jgi:Bacterial Ig-like domain (group 3)
MYCSALALSACGGGPDTTVPSRDVSANANKVSMLAATPVQKAVAAQMKISVAQAAPTISSAFVVSIQLPPGVDASSLDAVLNGTSVSSLFAASTCDGTPCLKATLPSSGAVRAGKNVLSAIARNVEGQTVSGRLRFDGSIASGTPSPAAKSQTLSAGARSATTALADVADPFLPPTVSFNTLTPGGWAPGGNSWFQIGSQNYPVSTPSNCSGAIYAVVVLDRQTLVQMSAAPESSPRCIANSTDLKAYLATLTASELVIVGTNDGFNADTGLDTSAIGGTAWVGKPSDHYYPSGYMAIGAGGQQAGSAYEAFYDSFGTDTTVLPFATGTLQEDAYGNYNFQSSDVVEYAVSPNDPAYLTSSTTSVIAVGIPASLQTSAVVRDIYTPSVTPASNGYWLLILNRATLQSSTPCGAGPTISPDGTSATFSGCGQFFDGAQSANVNSSYVNLAAALNAVNSWQIAILTTVKQAGGSSQAVTVQSNTQNNGFLLFEQALAKLGGTAYLAATTNPAPTDAYTFIGYPGAINPLTGYAVESSTVLASQGQTGLVHGTLQRNQNGLFTPSQTSQESVGLFAAKGGVSSPDFQLAVASYQQPVPWPSSSTTTLLPGASSTIGQLAAYRFISHELLAGHYIKGIQGPHQDDLHYFFTGSSNTFIDYHNFDPISLTFPAQGGSATDWADFLCSSVVGNTCTMTYPGDTVPSSFTTADFRAVQAQLSLEVQHLTNVLQFMVSGSTNLKDVIAGGNANVGLALTGAAATILGSKLVPAPPTTTVNFSWQNILSMIGGIVSVAATAEGLGELTTAWSALSASTQKGIKAATGTANLVGGMLGVSSSAGQIRSETTTHALPSIYGKFATTIGQLASSNLQDQLSSGFDASTDSITSDWGRLSLIGTMVVDTSNPVFYSPNQVSQNIAIASLTQASSRSFYMALMPNFYFVHYWPGTDPGTTPNPDMGYLQGHLETTCTAFYLNPNTTYPKLGTMQPYQSIWQLTPGAGNSPFDNDQAANPIDWYIIAGVSANPGTDSTFIPSIDPQLANNLFSPAGLNIPMAQFVAPNGPMSSVWVDASVKNPAHHENSSICPAYAYPQGDEGASPPGGGSATSGTGADGLTTTTTTLTGASSAVLGGTTVLTATINAGGQPVLVGSVYFVVNGVVVGNSPIGAGGVATYTLADSALGDYSVQAQYSRDGNYDPSSSAPQTLGVYSESPDLSLTVSASSLPVGYGKPSAPVDVQVSSVAGLAGNVSFACSGLPAGMACTFAPAQATLAADGSVATSFVVTSNGATASAGLFGLLFVPMSLIGWRRRRDQASARRALPLLLLLGAMSLSLGGCGGGSNETTLQESGTRTILVTATVGTVSRSIPVDVTIE